MDQQSPGEKQRREDTVIGKNIILGQKFIYLFIFPHSSVCFIKYIFSEHMYWTE